MLGFGILGLFTDDGCFLSSALVECSKTSITMNATEAGWN
jgi:hypothetical protein